MKVGELVLFPAVRALHGQAIIAASGTSCRHQIRDGTGRTALHPAVVLREALMDDFQEQPPGYAGGLPKFDDSGCRLPRHGAD